ncbi:MAG TPA: plasma-membrane proton-efflux P-type ATPase [Chitinophagaceae bacterium]|nr:plasma-membrane proton-efflux P-type ATPase [Chitinophagaceae bacterium]
MPVQQNKFAVNTVEEALAALQVQPEKGLSQQEALHRQSTYGLNEVSEKEPSMALLFLKHFRGLTAVMLELTIIVSIFLHKAADVYLISGLMLFNAVIGFIQERKAAKTVEALKKSLQVTVRILRDAKWQTTPGNQLVPGDIIRIRSGDFIAADVKMINGQAGTDESALTGESQLKDKKAGDMLFSGSVVKQGECSAVVTATGLHTTFGRTAQLVQTAKPRLHMEEVVTSVVKILFAVVIIFVAITFTVSFFRGEAFLTILPLLLILLISAVPVALPAMFAVSMAKGSRQLAEKGILVSRLSATEDAATMTTLCMDKTGTITQNELSIQEIRASENFTADEVLLYGVLASVTANHDSIDQAFLQKAAEHHIDASPYRQVSFIPFSADTRKTEATVSKEDKQFTVMKGAYATIRDLCQPGKDAPDAVVVQWAARGFRAMAVAVVRDQVTALAGVVALADPPLKDSAQMISEIKGLGVRVKMLTGDALPIAREIAREVGMGDDIVSAALLREKTSINDKHAIIVAHSGFAEVLPEDKFTIVTNLQQHHEITGMTGDGVNDAPALKQAEVGIAVKSATDIAKQAASVILLQAGLENIILLIKVGRTIHHRIANWVVSKIAKTLFTVLFVCAAYLITGQFVVGASDMVVLLIIVDFVTLTLSADQVSGSRDPETWNIRPLVKNGFLLGVLMVLESLLWLRVAKTIFPITGSQTMHSFGFAILFFASIFNIIIVRTKDHFYSQAPAKIVVWAIGADVLLVCLILTTGIPGISSLPVAMTGGTLLYFAFCSFVINDQVKHFLLKGKKIPHDVISS